MDFYSLIGRETPRLRRYALALTRSSDRADDLVQKTLAGAIAKCHVWEAVTDVRAWLFTIMRTARSRLSRGRNALRRLMDLSASEHSAKGTMRECATFAA